MQASEGDGVRFTVRLSFYELVNKAGFSSTYQEKIYWEVWKIQLKVVSACQNPAGVRQPLVQCPSSSFDFHS